MRHLVRSVLLCGAIAAATTSCGGGSDADDPAVQGPRTQAVERLTAFGLTEEEAACIVDEMGAEAVVEPADEAALTSGGEYLDAAKACIDEG